MSPRRAPGVIALACVIAMVLGLPATGLGQQPPASAGMAVTTPSEALPAVDCVLEGVAQGAADLQAKASAAVAAKGEKYVPSLSGDEATTIAKADQSLQDWLAGHPVHRDAAEFQQKDHRWKISFVGGPKTAEVVEAEVYVDDATGDIHEVRVGPQVAWMMARGYEGAFGRPLFLSTKCVRGR
mgnify:CR=1 FL=1